MSRRPPRRDGVRVDSVLKVMISTDNHLGYLEKDPVRGDDSFRAFEEVLALAKSNEVDMVLLGGDLFHDNKPSRKTIVRTMKILREMCLGDENVRLAVRSDPRDVNYMNPCYAISLPIFIIHGNHDDPTGGAGLEALSALDLLSEANLITYFGKVNTSRKIEVAPILLEKGETKLALYGLGNVRDEVLYETWSKQKKVKWLCPAEEPVSGSGEDGDGEYNEDNDKNHSDDDDDAAVDDDDDNGEEDRRLARRKRRFKKRDSAKWFNLFVLHQNRYTRGSSRGISDTLLPPWLDFVVWGHEHDSFPTPTSSKPAIVQPGSTVATSLSAGESKAKHAIMLEIYKGKLKHRPIPLMTVRNFEFGDISLSAQKELSETDPDGVSAFLDMKVSEMVARQEALFDQKLASFQVGSALREHKGVKYPPPEFYVEKLTRIVRQPLVRLRVETTGSWESLANPQRFGQTFTGRAACAADILLFYRNKRRPLKRARPFLQGSSGGAETAHDALGDDVDDLIGAEGMDNAHPAGAAEDEGKIPRLVQYYLYHRMAGGSGLKFLELDKLTTAVEEFVVKSEPRAIPDYVSSFLKIQQDKTLHEAEKTEEPLDTTVFEQRWESDANVAAGRVLNIGQSEKAKQDRAEGDGDEDGDTGNAVDTGQVPTVADFQAGLDTVHSLLKGNPKLVAANAASRDAQARENARGRTSDDDDDEDFVTGTALGKSMSRGRGRGRGRTKAPTKPRKSAAASKGDALDRPGAKAKAFFANKPPSGAGSSRRPRAAAKRAEASLAELSDDDEVEGVDVVQNDFEQAADDDIVIDDSDDDDVKPVPRKRKATSPASGSRATSRTRREHVPSLGRTGKSAFSSRSRVRRTTATPTIDLDEESGDDAM